MSFMGSRNSASVGAYTGASTKRALDPSLGKRSCCSNTPKQQVLAEEDEIDGEEMEVLSSPLIGDDCGDEADGMRGIFAPLGDSGGEAVAGLFPLEEAPVGALEEEEDVEGSDEAEAPITLAPGGLPPGCVTSLAFIMTFWFGPGGPSVANFTATPKDCAALPEPL